MEFFNANGDSKINFYDSKIYNNYAMHNPIGLIYISQKASVINNTRIYYNQYMDKDSMLGEINQCDKLWFLSDTLTRIIQDLNLENFKFSAHSIQILFAGLEIHYSFIFNQEAFINSFTSNITLKSTEIYDVEINQTNIDVVGSIIKMEDIIISGIENPQNQEFVRITFDSNLIAKRIKFMESDSSLLTLISSEADIEDIEFTDITDTDLLIKLLGWKTVKFSQIKINNSSIIGKSFIEVLDSSEISIQDINSTGLDKFLF